MTPKLFTGLKLNLSCAAQFSEPSKAADDLKAFADMNEQRLYKLLKTCLDPHTDLKGLVKAVVCKKTFQPSPNLMYIL